MKLAMNKTGFTLAGSMIGMVVVGGMALAMGDIVKMAAKSGVSAQSSSAIASIMSLSSNALLRQESCDTSLKNPDGSNLEYDPANLEELGYVIKILNAHPALVDAITIAEAGQHLGAGSGIIEAVYLKILPVQNPAGDVGLGEVYIHFDRGEIFGSRKQIQKVALLNFSTEDVGGGQRGVTACEGLPGGGGDPGSDPGTPTVSVAIETHVNTCANSDNTVSCGCNPVFKFDVTNQWDDQIPVSVSCELDSDDIDGGRYIEYSKVNSSGFGATCNVDGTAVLINSMNLHVTCIKPVVTITE